MNELDDVLHREFRTCLGSQHYEMKWGYKLIKFTARIQKWMPDYIPWANE